MHSSIYRLLIAALLSLPLTSIPRAQGLDGNYFLRTCTAAIKQETNDPSLSPDEAIGGISCISYVSGFVDGLALAVGTNKSRRVVCFPEKGVPNEQMIRIFLKYLTDNPEKLHETGRMSLLIALAKAFPCR